MNVKKNLKQVLITGLFLCFIATIAAVVLAAPKVNDTDNKNNKNQTDTDVIQNMSSDADTSSKTNQKKSEEKKQAEQPQIEISSPTISKKIKENVSIEGVAKGADKVEVYLKQEAAPQVFIGAASVKDGKWEFNWDSKLTPNGQYQVVAQNEAGKIKETSSSTVTVDNPSKKTTSEGEITALANGKAGVLKETVKDIESSKNKIDEEAKKLNEPGKSESEKKLAQEVLEMTEDLGDVSINVASEAEETATKEKMKTLTQQVAEIDKKYGKTIALAKAKEIINTYSKNNEELINKIQTTAQKADDINLKIKENENIISNKASEEVLSNETKKAAEIIRETAKILEMSKFKEGAPNINASLDSDGDGLSDIAEAIYGTDNKNPDSDGDSYLDGVEIQNGFDPLNASTTSKIVYEEPKTAGEVMSDIYEVAKVSNTSTIDVVTKIEQKRPIFEGHALPNSFITLYIYSSLPIVVTTKVDANGYWSYVLSKPLESGEHEVYVAVTDNTGKIIAKSEPKPFFILAAQVVNAAEYMNSPEYAKAAEAQKTVQTMLTPYAYITLIVILAGLVMAIGAVVFIVYRNSQKKQ